MIGRLTLTPSQTVGPFLHIALEWADGPYVVPDGTPGAVRISGTVYDGGGQAVPDALIETWQADPDGHFAHPDDPRDRPLARPAPRSTTLAAPPRDRPLARPAPQTTPAAPPRAEGVADSSVAGFRGFGRCPTDSDGRFWLLTVKPGALPGADGATQAPHLDVTVLGRGMLDRVVTRLYFPDDTAAHTADALLSRVPQERRHTLIAEPDGDGLRFDIRLQGEGETVFLDL